MGLELSEWDKNQLLYIKEEQFGGDLKPEGPSFITEKTRQKLLEEYGMTSDITSNGILQSLGVQVPKPYIKALEITREYLEWFKNASNGKSTGQFYNYVSGWLEKTVLSIQPQMVSTMVDASAIGMIMVVKAFHIECGPEFMDNLLANQNKSIYRDTQFAFDDSFRRAEKTLSVLDRVDRKFKIPEYQVHLRSFANQFITQCAPVEPPVEEGVHEMYHVVDKMWPYLKPEFTQI